MPDWHITIGAVGDQLGSSPPRKMDKTDAIHNMIRLAGLWRQSGKDPHEVLALLEPESLACTWHEIPKQTLWEIAQGTYGGKDL